MHMQRNDLPIHLKIDPEAVAAVTATYSAGAGYPPEGWVMGGGAGRRETGPRTARAETATATEAYHPWKDTTGAEYGFCREVGGEFYIRIHDVGSFVGRRDADCVRGVPDAGATLDVLHEIFYCEVVPFLLQQRSWEVLHACGLVVEGAWIALSGRSQVGKSTLAYAWRWRGGQVYADDAIPFRVVDGRVPVCPVPFQIRLRSPSVEYFGADGREGAIHVEALDPVRALHLLLRQAYSYTPYDRGRNRALVETYMDLANVLPTFRLSYPTALGPGTHPKGGVNGVLDEVAATVASLCERAA